MRAPHRVRLRAFALIGCLMFAWTGHADAQQLRVVTHAGSVDGLLANSHLIAGRTEGLLVDAQLTRSDARAVVAMIQRAQIERLTVFITHARPDHYLGLAEILDAFPRARVFSNAPTATAIAQNGPRARDRWKQALGDDIADRVIVPEVPRGREIAVERTRVRIITPRDSSESVLPAVLYVKQHGWLFSGDLVFSGVHLWLAEGRARKWRGALEELSGIGAISMIYPGHGEAGPAELIERNKTYLTRFMELARKTDSATQLYDGMAALYPAYRLPSFLRRSAESIKEGAIQ